jgi:hypothetical protein
MRVGSPHPSLFMTREWSQWLGVLPWRRELRWHAKKMARAQTPPNQTRSRALPPLAKRRHDAVWRMCVAGIQLTFMSVQDYTPQCTMTSVISLTSTRLLWTMMKLLLAAVHCVIYLSSLLKNVQTPGGIFKLVPLFSHSWPPPLWPDAYTTSDLRRDVTTHWKPSRIELYCGMWTLNEASPFTSLLD